MTDHCIFFFRTRKFRDANIYLKVPVDKTEAVTRAFDGFDDDPDSASGWTTSRRALLPGVAVEWTDRAYVLPARQSAALA